MRNANLKIYAHLIHCSGAMEEGNPCRRSVPPLTTSSSGPVDEIAAALAFDDGDVRAAVKSVLGDIKFLMQELAVTQIGMSIGFTGGWQPNFERNAAEEIAHTEKP
jgi:hypothetical protein